MPIRTNSGLKLFMESAIAAAKTITAITKAAPGVFSSTAHGFANGDLILLEIQGMVELHGSLVKVVSVATDTLPGDEPIDICEVVEGEKGISHFMLAHITPFYEKRWGSFLRDFKQNRII